MIDQKPRKRRRFLWILLFLVAIPVLLMVSLGSIVGALLSPEVTVEPGSVLEINLSGSLSEGPSIDILAELTGEKKGSVWGLRRAIRAAAEDERHRGDQASDRPDEYRVGLCRRDPFGTRQVSGIWKTGVCPASVRHDWRSGVLPGDGGRPNLGVSGNRDCCERSGIGGHLLARHSREAERSSRKSSCSRNTRARENPSRTAK